MDLSTSGWIIPSDFSSWKSDVFNNLKLKTIDVTNWDISRTDSLSVLFSSQNKLEEII
jgi:hypothetical protein